MAEQEACAELVEKASEESEKKESVAATIQGESLLLPLLQGLLDAPENEQTADSGTESGEDLRSGLILEVQSALAKLSASLTDDSSDMSSERRDSLLQLVSRLQVGLSTQITPSSSSERRASLNTTRFGKRRQRANRHTVGVTTEELEDARRLMQEIAFRDNIVNTNTVKPLEYTPLQKQHSEGSVVQTSPFKQHLKHPKVKPVTNLTAKPYISSTNTSQSQSGTSSTVDTPTETSESLDFLISSPEKSQTDIPQQEVALRDKKPQHQHAYHQSISLESEKASITPRRPLSEALSLDYSREIDLKSVQMAVTQAAAIKQLSQLKSDVSESAQDSETDDDPVTIKVVPQPKPQIQEIPPAYKPSPPPPPAQPQPDLILQTNPVYLRPDNSDTENDECSSQYAASDSEKANRFNSKKLRMKRANTIDIPKPLKYYEYDDESEGEHDSNSSRRNSYLALRGPISVGKFSTNKKVVPEFQPKTDSDHKFMAFLNKHTAENTDSVNKTSIWAKQQDKNWSSKFGHIKTTFEKVGGEKSASVNSARNFWKTADDATSAGKVSHIGPKISRQSARNLQQMFEEKQKQSQQQKTPWSVTNNKNIVTGSLKVDTKAFEGNKTVKVVPQPHVVNKFSHAPMSAFKPVPKKSELPLNQHQQVPTNVRNTTVQLKPPPQVLTVPTNGNGITDSQSTTPESPLYLYSPKPLSPQNDTASPVFNSTPWGPRTSDTGRVLSIAASKFQNCVPEQNHVRTRRISNEKIAIPPALQQLPQTEKLISPYLVKNLGQSNTVRKLSGQYDKLESKNNYSQQPHKLPSNQNQYGQHFQKPPKVYNAAYTISTQPYNVPQSNHQSFAHQTYHQTFDRLPQQNEAIPPQYNTFQADVAVQQRHYHNPPQNYNQPQVHHHKQIQEDSQQQYTSSYQFKPQTNTEKYPPDVQRYYASSSPLEKPYVDVQQQIQPEPLKIFDYPSPPTSPQNRPVYEKQTSRESLKEYTAISSKVMFGPVSQQAVTVQQKSPKNRDQHDMDAAFNLKSSLDKFNRLEQRNGGESQQQTRKPLSTQSFKIKIPTAYEGTNAPVGGHVVYNNVGRSMQKPAPPDFYVNDKPLSLESLEINERGESVLSSKFHIPVKTVGQNLPTPGQVLSKSESWHQICQGGGSSPTNKPSPRASPNTRSVSRSKSSHTLSLPKQYEAGMSKSEMLEKRRTIEAYFGDQSLPKIENKAVEAKKSAINRVKTSQKISTQRQISGLCRSRTLPDIVCLDKLDDNNIDEVFEDLFQSST